MINNLLILSRYLFCFKGWDDGIGVLKSYFANFENNFNAKSHFFLEQTRLIQW